MSKKTPPPIYMPKPRPSETQEARRARYRRRYLQVAAELGGTTVYIRSDRAGALPHNRDTTSMSNAAEKPMAMSAPQSTETKTDADDSGQVAAQTNPAPPAAHIPSGSRLLTQKVLIVMSSLLLFVAMFLLHLSNMITDGSAVATAATVVTISAQVLISLSFYLDHKESGGHL